MGQAIALENIGKALANAFQLLGRSRHEIRDRMRERVHDIVVVALDERQLATHTGCLLAVLGWRLQANRLCCLHLLGLGVAELIFVTKRAPWVGHKGVLNDLFGLFVGLRTTRSTNKN